ncbi:MAG: HAD family hydrolase [SAR202 cluster bacterium]|nr:HAD family hydrolase [SAR202 cluster bacterium]|tara:strand:- start:10439 stop:11050 length:612 start_codon:yes stop_codon:yes gene_type:complete
MELRAVFFDLDGVLIDSSNANMALMNHFAKDLDNASIEISSSGISSDSIEYNPRSQYQDPARSNFKEYLINYADIYIQNLVQNSEAKQLLDTLDSDGILSAVVTNSDAEMARTILETKNLFPNILVGDDGRYRKKPAPDMIFRACELLNVPPWEIMYVGDSQSDYDAAMAAGCLFVGFGISGNFTISKLSEILNILKGAGPSS